MNILSRFAPWLMALLFLGGNQTWAASASLVGDWVGSAEFKGQRGSFAIHLNESSDGGLDASISMPPLDVYRLAVGQAAEMPGQVPGQVIVMGVSYTLSDDGMSMTGPLPAAIVPVHEIIMTLRKVEGWSESSDYPVTAPAPRHYWSQQLKSPVYAGITLFAGNVVVATDKGCVHALNPEDGEEVWRHCLAGPIRATPLSTPDGLFVHADDGGLYRLDPNGVPQWRASISSEPVRREVLGYQLFSSAPVISDGRILVGSHAGELVSVSADRGEVLQRIELGSPTTATPGLGNDQIVIGASDGRVHSFSLAGEPQWQFDTGAAVVSRPAFDQGRVIIGSRSYDLFALDQSSGQPIWDFYFWFSWVESSAVIDRGVAYVGSSDGQLLRAINIESGELVWSLDTGGSAWSTPAFSSDSVVIGAVGVPGYMVEHHGSLLCADRTRGALRWRLPADSSKEENWGFAANPIIVGDRVYAATLDGQVYALPRC